jgi:uncharacterized membrane protein
MQFAQGMCIELSILLLLLLFFFFALGSKISRGLKTKVKNKMLEMARYQRQRVWN